MKNIWWFSLTKRLSWCLTNIGPTMLPATICVSRTTLAVLIYYAKNLVDRNDWLIGNFYHKYIQFSKKNATWDSNGWSAVNCRQSNVLPTSVPKTANYKHLRVATQEWVWVHAIWSGNGMYSFKYKLTNLMSSEQLMICGTTNWETFFKLSWLHESFIQSW